jgi:hypothetical protein
VHFICKRTNEEPDILAEFMGTWLAFAAFMEQRLADDAAERAQLERIGIIAEWAFCWHHTGIGILFFGVPRTLLVLTTTILTSDRAYTTTVLLRFCRACSCIALIGFHRVYTATAGGGSREGAERAHDPLPGSSYKNVRRCKVILDIEQRIIIRKSNRGLLCIYPKV